MILLTLKYKDGIVICKTKGVESAFSATPGEPKIQPIIDLLPKKWSGESIKVITPHLLGKDCPFGDLLKIAIFGSWDCYSYKKINLVHCPTQLNVEEITLKIYRVLNYLEIMLGDLPTDNLIAILRIGRGISGAYSYPGIIVVNVDSEHRSEKSIYRAIAHEIIHQWISLSGEDLGSGRWLFEALPSYLSELVLLRTGIISQNEFQEERNKRIYLAGELTPNTGEYLSDHYSALTKGYSIICKASEDNPDFAWNFARKIIRNE